MSCGRERMAEQTGQHGYLFKFDKVNATASMIGGADRILDQVEQEDVHVFP